MIEVDHLEKSYGFARALRGISFSVSKGEVIGFLGPNGAGKSTTMKILTGYLAPSGGRATVGNLDVVKESLAVRAMIGYLPESTPLYSDMRVDDYLSFCAEIRGVVGKQRRQAIARAVQLCGLARVTGKNIVELSKGYKQRVGLAQAIVHEPPVLILDEPTSGLDPNQIVEVRRLIERLGEEHTVVLSTHYLQEVEKSCSRVIIVNHGEIVADGTQEELLASQEGGGLRVTVRGPDPAVRAQFAELLPGVTIETIQLSDGGADDRGNDYRLLIDKQAAPIDESVARLIVKNGWDLLALHREQPSLEDVFRRLTIATSEAPVEVAPAVAGSEGEEANNG